MNDEYSKPYEYEEEKKGLIIMFVAMILGIDTLQTIFFAVQENKYMGHISMLRIAIPIISSIFILYIIYTAIFVFRMKNNFVTAAKRYIIIRTIFSLFSYIIIFLNRLKYENLIGESEGSYQSVAFMLYIELLMPLIFVMLFCVAWYLYFTYSKRCKKVAD